MKLTIVLDLGVCNPTCNEEVYMSICDTLLGEGGLGIRNSENKPIAEVIHISIQKSEEVWTCS